MRRQVSICIVGALDEFQHTPEPIGRCYNDLRLQHHLLVILLLLVALGFRLLRLSLLVIRHP